MQSDDDLRARFHALADAESSAAPPFKPDAIQPRPFASNNRSASHWRHRAALLGASAAGAVVALTIGLIWGTNTGYASARVEGKRQRDEMAASTAEVKSQLAALRLNLARVRTDLARRARGGDEGAKASMVFAESELRSMEASAERIELGLAERRDVAATIPPMQLIGFPMKRALAITCSALGQPALPPEQGIPVVDLPPAPASTSETFGGILGVRQSSDGSVLVNDAARRQVRLLDTTLSTSTVVMDSTPGSSTSYGLFATTLIPYVGDSSLFADRPTQTMLVLDGRGRVARSLALPRTRDFFAINNGPTVTDAEGRLIYRSTRPSRMHLPMANQTMAFTDSIPILRADLEFRRVDTIGQISRPVMKLITEPTSDGRVASVWAVDPLQPVDEWAMLSNGAVAFVRGHDYHIDWIQPGGAMTASAKLPFEWKRLTEDDKQRMTDSVRAAQSALLANGYPQAEYAMSTPCAPTPPGGGGGSGRSGGSGAPASDADRSGCANVIQTSAIPSVGGIPARAMPPLPALADMFRANPIFDYLPPIGVSATLADRDGNLWILPRMSALSRNGELVYDVVNAQGKLFERVRLPAGRSIAGFAKGGVVYLQSGDRTNGFHLERTRLAPHVPAPPK